MADAPPCIAEEGRARDACIRLTQQAPELRCPCRPREQCSPPIPGDTIYRGDHPYRLTSGYVPWTFAYRAHISGTGSYDWPGGVTAYGWTVEQAERRAIAKADRRMRPSPPERLVRGDYDRSLIRVDSVTPAPDPDTRVDSVTPPTPKGGYPSSSRPVTDLDPPPGAPAPGSPTRLAHQAGRMEAHTSDPEPGLVTPLSDDVIRNQAMLLRHLAIFAAMSLDEAIDAAIEGGWDPSPAMRATIDDLYDGPLDEDVDARDALP